MSSSLEHTFAHSIESFVLMFLCLKYAYTHKKTKKAYAQSSLARTRDLILMQSPMSARAQYKSNDQIPGPSQE